VQGSGVEVFYDGWCPLCLGVKRNLERMDWLNRLVFTSFRDHAVADELGVPAEAMAERMYARVQRSGRVVSGVDAFAAIAAHVPLLWPAFPLIWLSSRIGIGGWVYDLVASRRTIIPVGQCDLQGCPLPNAE